MSAARKILAPLGAFFIVAGYIATVPAANWTVKHFGQVPVGFGLAAPAGVYFAGLALALRDAARERAGRAVTLAAMAAGVALSYWLADSVLALASAAAFAVAEGLDYFVYERLRKRDLMLALGVSNLLGLVADSLAFLWLAFGSLQFLPGQLFGKAWVTLLAIVAMTVYRRRKAVTA